MEAKLFAVRVFVRDWDRALEFYTAEGNALTLLGTPEESSP